MRKKIQNGMVALLLVLLTMCLFGCKGDEQPAKKIELIFNGDIQKNFVVLDLNECAKQNFVGQNNETMNGWNVDDLLSKISKISQSNTLFVTASDGISVEIEEESAKGLYFYQSEEQICAYSSVHPRAVRLKDIVDVTVVSKENVESGIKVLSQNATKFLSGKDKKSFFELDAENSMNGVVAKKFVPKKNVTAFELTKNEKCNVYFEDFGVESNVASKNCIWKNGKIHCKSSSGEFKPVFGFTIGTTKLISSIYDEMKQSVDANQKVMFVLLDGFGMAQQKLLNQSSKLFAYEQIMQVSAVMNPAISPVGLATMLGGKSPLETGIFARPFKQMACDDIFVYAKDKNKSVAFIEGNSKLIGTSIEPTLNLADENGYTDYAVYQSAENSINDGKEVIVVHFHGIDDANHKFGFSSTKSIEKVLEIENYIVELAKKFDGKVVMTADHGHVELLDENQNKYGKHGLFLPNDMFVPFYVFEK